jgi:hypothetical protein
MKRLFILSFSICAIGIAHAQYFSGNQPGVPLLGKASPIDGGALTNLNATNLVGTIPSANLSGLANTNQVVFTNDTTWFQPKKATLTTLATLNGNALTNLANAPIVVSGGAGVTVIPSTNATTGQITYTLTVP